MHNVKRLSAAKRAERRRENEERAKRYNALSSAVMAMRKEGQHDQAALDAAESVLHINPDHATVWNFRRTVLKHMHPHDTDADARRAACEREFKLTQEALGANPKSYPSWFHRMWTMEWGCCEWQWATEMKLTAKMLALDERNFHCWTYRRFVARLASVPAEKELDFCLGKVETNFSNYSAWHYRSKLLPVVHGARDGAVGPAYEEQLRNELTLLRSAFFTAPEDQSAWFYQRWLFSELGLTAAGGDGGGTAPSESLAALMRDELAVLTELLELEPDCKWPLAAATFLGDALGESAQTERLLRELSRVDPMRKAHYEHMLARRGNAAPTP